MQCGDNKWEKEENKSPRLCEPNRLGERTEYLSDNLYLTASVCKCSSQVLEGIVFLAAGRLSPSDGAFGKNRPGRITRFVMELVSRRLVPKHMI